MKILYIITKSEFGGAQTYVWQLAGHFSYTGNEVAIMAYPSGWLEEKAKENGIKFYPNKFFLNAPHPIKDVLAFVEIVRVIKKFNPDIIHVNSAKAGILGRIAAFLCRKKIVYTVHGWAFVEGASLWRRILGIVSERIVCFLPQKIICVSKYDYNLVLRYKIVSPEKLSLIHNGVEIEKDLPEKKWDYPLKIVFIGRFALPKDPFLLTSAFSELRDDLKEKAEIFIIGDGPDKSKLQNLIKEKNLGKYIHLTGRLERQSVFDILEKSHIFVLVTNYEAFPYTTLEAMSFGLAIIVSNVGGAPEATDESCGILIEKGDKKSLKAALEKLIQDIDLTKKMGEKARERAMSKFSIEKMINELKIIYEEF